MIKLIKYGFRPVINTRIRGQNSEKGKKLFEARHILDVLETENSETGEVFITCKAVGQTSIKNLYDVKITLDCNRNVIDAACTCKAGKSGKCKHMCALVHYVNSPETAESKTSYSQAWGRPSHRQLLQYDKGVRMNGLIPSPPLCRKAAALKPVQLSTSALGESLSNSPIFKMVQIEEKSEAEIIAAESLLEIKRALEKNSLEEKATKICLEIFMLQLINNLRFSSSIVISEELNEFYAQKVCCDINSALEIGVGTIDQACNPEWFRQRKLRITASNCHKLKGTKYDIQKAVMSLSVPSRIETSAMSYGKRNEALAFEEYKKFLGPECELVKIGLIINLQQPWLSCSPDGVIIMGPNIWEKRLLEIKCPYNCRQTPIFDSETSKINVPYLIIDENGFQLKNKHCIYTQIQVQMYVTNITFCDLFVYSPKGSILICVSRNNEFLSKTVPCIEGFYFKHYLPELHSKDV